MRSINGKAGWLKNNPWTVWESIIELKDNFIIFRDRDGETFMNIDEVSWSISIDNYGVY